ncbi:hypothetical protein F5148DRAFT_1150355 [Russula earlei]|uniref:Uncharacterized protein n=1 Tax=Russula earlei TaxID=71964 RepID=A0ACC0U4V3_9AGAM|nr:hypothetical protein F5148DRAFT_1150355 [Russula earlei]
MKALNDGICLWLLRPYQGSCTSRCFQFFVGLGDFVLDINTAVGRIYGRRYKDRGPNGVSKSVSPNMSQGQIHLAMEETGKRMRLDEVAIRWLIDNMSEEAEMEIFAMAIPGSFNTEWGILY